PEGMDRCYAARLFHSAKRRALGCPQEYIQHQQLDDVGERQAHSAIWSPDYPVSAPAVLRIPFRRLDDFFGTVYGRPGGGLCARTDRLNSPGITRVEYSAPNPVGLFRER